MAKTKYMIDTPSIPNCRLFCNEGSTLFFLTQLNRIRATPTV
jgi:hypothetical protein